MASEFIASINFAIKQISIYCGIPITIIGFIGNFLNVIVFLSLKTFRQSSCAFYLMTMSAFDLGRLFLSTFYNIMRWGFGIDWAISSLFFCKIRVSILVTCSSISMTCLCLAIIDQYFATCSRPRWQQWCNIKLAHRLVAIVVIIWSLHGIPYLVFDNQSILPSTNQIICQITNNQLITYITYGYFVIFTILLPLITVVFGLMAYYNARNLAYRTVPLVRRELDKQLTVMVLVQVLINFCTFLPYTIDNMCGLITTQQSDLVFGAKKMLAMVITFYFSSLSYVTSFYTYVCVSKRFRRQLKHVLFEVHFKQCRPKEIHPDEVPPEIMANK